MPGWLYAGDRLLLPVQAVNTTGAGLEGRVAVVTSGALEGSVEALVRLTPGGSAVRVLPLDVRGAGPATVKASLFTDGPSDAAERTLSVRPTGRPVERAIGGTLTGARALRLPGPAGADPSTEHVEVQVFPGPLSVLQAELERIDAGGADSTYAFAVADALETMAASLQVELPDGAVRRTRILAWQDLARRSLAPSGGEAADLLLGLRTLTGHELAMTRRDVLVQQLISAQRADGTFSRQATSTAQRVLVETAYAAMALPASAAGPRLRAAGAVERMLPQVNDAYTASVLLASGLVSEGSRPALRALVEAALVEVDGAATLPVPAGVRGPHGDPPSAAEVAALGALALDGDVAGDLVASVMRGWTARDGFGAGPADPLALEAIVRALPAAQSPVVVSLWSAGQELSRGTLDPAQPKSPLILKVSPGAGEIELRAEPATAGLAFVATRRSWVPWSAADRLPGVDVEVDVGQPQVGRAGALTLRMSAPSGTALVVEQGLPAGAVVDESALAGLVASFDVHPDRLVFTTRPLGAGEILELVIPVTPAFAGSFHTAPLRVSASGQQASLQPALWSVDAG
jgi:hypothetical protein